MDVHAVAEGHVAQPGTIEILLAPATEVAADVRYYIRDNRQDLRSTPEHAKGLPERESDNVGVNVRVFYRQAGIEKQATRAVAIGNTKEVEAGRSRNVSSWLQFLGCQTPCETAQQECASGQGTALNSLDAPRRFHMPYRCTHLYIVSTRGATIPARSTRGTGTQGRPHLILSGVTSRVIHLPCGTRKWSF